ncbi:MAG: peptidoglycan-associated lipoprotein Pal [Gemmatimonadaceae bacterium]
MSRRRLCVVALVGFVIARPSAAQNAGNVEVGGFGQYTHADDAWHVKSGFGLGGRLGVFVTHRWALEGDASFSTFSNQAPRASGNTQQETFAGRLMYNIPFGMGSTTNQFMLGAGVGGQRFAGHSDFSASPDVGLRFVFGNYVALRFDGLVEYVENPTAATFGFPPVVGVNNAAARSTNVEIRGGVSFLIGNSKPAPPPPPVRTEAPPPRREPAPPPRREAPPTPPAPTVNRDSIDAVDRAREALLAKIYFDFDRSALRDDQRAVLDSKLPVLQANPNVRIRIEGNADERGSDEYNLALGTRRAQTARKYLTDHGVDASRIDISSNGEERPVCQDHNEDCWKQNRRDEFVIVAGGDRLVAPR